MAEVQFQHLPYGTRTSSEGVCGDRMDRDPDMLAGIVIKTSTTDVCLRLRHWEVMVKPCSGKPREYRLRHHPDGKRQRHPTQL